jgi:hypothetical protein
MSEKYTSSLKLKKIRDILLKKRFKYLDDTKTVKVYKNKEYKLYRMDNVDIVTDTKDNRLGILIQDI